MRVFPLLVALGALQSALAASIPFQTEAQADGATVVDGNPLTTALAASTSQSEAAGGTGVDSTLTTATAYYNASASSVRVVLGVQDTAKGAAVATHNATLNVTGWDTLWVTGLSNVPDFNAAFAMGYLEGFLTHESIWATKRNEFHDFWDNKTSGATEPSPIAQWLADNLSFMRAQVNSSSPVAAPAGFWPAVKLLLAQFDGLIAGYAAGAKPYGPGRALSEADWLVMQANGDIETLMDMWPAAQTPWLRTRARNYRCSALFKLAPRGDDVFFGHTTWDDFSMMVRSLKTYRYDLAPGSVLPSGATVSMSSSPGWISSVDDFYLTSPGGLGVIETTNGVYNNSLFGAVTTDTVPSWARVMVANLLASNTTEWAALFSALNSGTYNNQWMVLDTKLVPADAPANGKPSLPPNTFYVLEQIPGLVVGADQTATLVREGYWGSYNIPFYPRIYNLSGFAAQHRAHRRGPHRGNGWSHGACARANIFRARQGGVRDVRGAARLLRYNDWRHDPDSLARQSSAEHLIAT